MRRRAKKVFVWALGLGLWTTGAHGQQRPSMPMGPPPEPDTSRIQQEMTAQVAAGPLRVTFDKKSAEWTPEKLAALPHTTITVFNEHSKASETYSGVPVIDLLTPLGISAKPHGKDFRLYLVAEGADGYAVVYALAEVIPAVHDATVMVADAMGGKPLGPTGPLQLVATGEKHPSRWVRNLVSIRVETAR